MLHGGTAFLNIPRIIERLHITPGQIIADLGCGGGGHFVVVSAQVVGSDGIVYALDVQKKVLEIVKGRAELAKLDNIELIWSNLEHYGAAQIPDAACDVASLVNVLFQNKDYETILKEALRMVRPGGLLGIVDWELNKGQQFGPPTAVRVDKEVIKKLGNALQLALVDEFAAGPYHYAIVFKK